MGKTHWEESRRDNARPMGIWRLLVRVATLAAALLSGTLFTACPMYGVVYPMYGVQPAYGIIPPPHDATVQITDFNDSPASPIHVGDELVFSATLNHPPAEAGAETLQAEVGNPPANTLLVDDGQAPDVQAADGIYTGSFIWTLAPAADAPMKAHLYWSDGAPGQTLDGPPLTVLADEEGQ